MIKKIIISISVMAIVSAVGYYAYLNVFNNQYEFTYELLTRKDLDIILVHTNS